MRKLVLASILALGLGSVAIYANQAAIELEHAVKSAVGNDGVASDMSEMKAAGKCGADQKAKIKTKAAAHKHTTSEKAALEVEHANKVATGDDGVAGDMGDMKAHGKCASK